MYIIGINLGFFGITYQQHAWHFIQQCSESRTSFRLTKYLPYRQMYNTNIHMHLEITLSVAENEIEHYSFIVLISSNRSQKYKFLLLLKIFKSLMQQYLPKYFCTINFLLFLLTIFSNGTNFKLRFQKDIFLLLLSQIIKRPVTCF